MTEVLEHGLTVTPAMVRMNPSGDSDWARSVLAFVERAAIADKPVRLAVVDVSYSPAEVARLVGVSKATVHRRIEDGTLKASRVGARYRVGQSEVERYRDWLMGQTAAALADDF